MEEVLILKEVFSRSGHLHSFGEGYHRQIFLVFVSPLCIQAAHFLGACDVCDTGVHAHGLLRCERKHTHTHTHTHKAGLLLSLLIVSSSSPVKLKLCFPEVSSQYSAQEPFSDKPHYSTDA